MPRSRAEHLGPALAILAHVTVVRAQSPDRTPSDAQAHVDKGLALYEAKEYAQAAIELRAAYELKKDRDVLYALAQANRLAGDCPTALTHYREFLESNPPGKQADLARKNIARCEETKPAPTPAPVPPAPTAPTSAPTADMHATAHTLEPVGPAPAPRIAWYRDVPGDLLLGGGVGAGVVAGYFFYASSSELQSARSATRYDDAQTHADRAHGDRQIALVGSAAAGAFVVAAILRYVLHDERDAGRGAAVASVAASGSGVAVRF
jgi:tetratricopeptide (TPR) repeat protein